MSDISTLTDVNGNVHNIKDATARERLVPTGGTAGQVLTAGANNTRTWEDPAGAVDTVNGISPDANKNVETAKDVTTSEYEALPSTKTSDNKDYYLTDGEPSVATANDIPYTSTQSVKGALDDLNNGLTNVGKIEYLGSKQGTGTATLSSSITNFRFLYIRVGFYSSGFPNYGTALIPVDGLNLTSDTTYAITIPVYESAAGCVRVGFNNATTLRVDSTYNADRFVRVFGVK